MRKYIEKERVFSSNSKQIKLKLTPQKSLSKLKQRVYSDFPTFGNLNHKQRINAEYIIKNQHKMQIGIKLRPKETQFKRRRKQSLDSINRDIKFQNQLKEEIKNLNITLFSCQNLQKELIKQKNAENILDITSSRVKNLKGMNQNHKIPPIFKQLVYLEQRIKNRQKYIKSVSQSIVQLKQDNWNMNVYRIPLEQKSLEQSNAKIQRFLLADEMYELNLLLKEKMEQHQNKYNDLRVLKQTVNNAFKDSQQKYQLKVNSSSQNTNILQLNRPVTYDQFKQNLKNKNNSQKPKNDLQRVKSLQRMPPCSKNQFSNISNISAVLPNNFFIEEWLNRQLLPGEIPTLPKQHNPTVKSMNIKIKILKQAIQTQKVKHQKILTQLVDKLLFLRDQDAFLSEQIQDNQSQADELQAKFNGNGICIGIETRTKLPTSIRKQSMLCDETCCWPAQSLQLFYPNSHRLIYYQGR